MGMVTKHGYCRYCNNPRIIEIYEDATQEECNAVASDECDCYGAEEARKREYQKGACIANIDLMLAEKRPEIAEIFRNCIDALQDKKIKKITINTYGNTSARMYANKDGIKIEVEKKLKEENLA